MEQQKHIQIKDNIKLKSQTLVVQDSNKIIITTIVNKTNQQLIHN